MHFFFMLLLVLDGLLRSQTGVASYTIWVLHVAQEASSGLCSTCSTGSWYLGFAPPTLGSCNLLMPQDVLFVKGGVASGCTFTCLNSWKEVNSHHVTASKTVFRQHWHLLQESPCNYTTVRLHDIKMKRAKVEKGIC
jgi:hypothetical protein